MTRLIAPRSLLAVPASNPRLLDSALRRPASALMVDLEDGVDLDAKDAARHSMTRFIADHGTAPTVLTVRINDPDSHVGCCDLRALEDTGPSVAAVVLPKATTKRSRDLLAQTRHPVIALIETPEGVEDAYGIARLDGVVGVVFGNVDYAAELSAVGGWHASDLSWAKARIVNAAAAGHVWALSGPSVALDDEYALRVEVDTDRALGFAGKLCIHPAQLAPVNQGFAPTPAQVDWARRVLLAVETQGSGAIKVDGRMVDKPVVAHARTLLANVDPEGPR